MDEMWCRNKEIGKYMYLVGKYRNKKNDSKLTQTVNNIKKHYKSLRSACRNTSVHWSQFQKWTQLREKEEDEKEEKKYKRKLKNSDKRSIRKFFHSDDMSFPLPEKKFVGKWFMKRSIEKGWKMYNLLPTTTRKISMSTFRKYRPKNIKLQGKIPFRQSCCEVCQNFEFVLEQGSKYLQGIPKTLDDSIDSSMCAYSGYFEVCISPNLIVHYVIVLNVG